MGLNAVDLGLSRLSRESDIEDEVIPQAENTQESALLGYIFIYSHAARARAGSSLQKQRLIVIQQRIIKNR